MCGDSPTAPLLRDTAESEWREDTELLVSSVMAGRKGVLSVDSPGELVETPFTIWLCRLGDPVNILEMFSSVT